MFISQLARNAKALRPLELLKESVEENKEYILDLNTSQLSKGNDSKGQPLTPYASQDYAQYKMSIGSKAPFGTPNLYLEGDFYRGFNLKADQEGFTITSSDSKTGKLINMYSEDIFGLDTKSMADQKSVVLPTFIKKLKDELFKT